MMIGMIRAHMGAAPTPSRDTTTGGITRKGYGSSFVPIKAPSVIDYFEKGFRIGSVYRVSCLNFLTYDECEVFPGPKLNVVIGPNGTGKSTLTHAICLACCGSTSDVGK